MFVKMLARLAAVFVFMLTAGSAAYAQRTVLEDFVAELLERIGER